MLEMVIDNFAGGGGASLGIERAIGRPIDIAINHDPEALAMHRANHPGTKHLCENVFRVQPEKVTAGRRVGLAWFSPDCTHHSKAKGGKPRSNKRRGLAWVAIRWVKRVKPRVIMLENVEEFEDWGPLLPNGQPCPERRGQTFLAFIAQLERFGYKVEYRELKACDYGAPTIRKRLFLIARCDGMPITWPEPTHGPGRTPYRTAAECIDWSIPCPSIFERKKPLAPATCRRVATGIVRFVVNNPRPFIIGIDHQSNGNSPVWSADAPLNTITCENRHALVMPTLIQTGYGERKGQSPRVLDLQKPLGTVVAGGAKHALVTAFLAKNYTGVIGAKIDKPLGTITTADHHSLVTSHLIKLRGTCKDGQEIDKPLPTITAGGLHIGEIRAFLIKYYSEGGQWNNLHDPLHTVPTHDRLGLVTVTISGDQYILSDIGLRMFQPHELARGQGFSTNYILAAPYSPPGHPSGRTRKHPGYLTKTSQVRMIGNSVAPDVAEALVRANYNQESTKQTIAA